MSNERKTATLRYSNDEIVVLWKPSLCAHSGICARGLGEVFNPQRRPWIDPLAATTEQIIAQVEKCPSGALTWEKAPAPEVE
ncbi:MAG: (4Fe-4S)-binding protein [Fimbriimonadaceae bacterium]|nr:(4Fe-4S)-binding protein [Fimbriimonadaceae bacterium]